MGKASKKVLGVLQKGDDSSVPTDQQGFVATHSREKALAKAYIEAVAKNPATFVDFISPDDEMYIFIRNAENRKETPLYLYFKAGREALQSIENIIQSSGRSLKRIRSFLDFASGYGRVTRFLVQEMDAGNVWISDIYRAAVDFQRECFKVNGFYSETEPSKLKFPREFEVVYVGSLFSHLPETRFKEWLSKLYEVLEDDGILIFSTHGESLLPDCYLADTSGFTFLSTSESRSLSSNEYGSSYVTRDWVERTSAALGISNIYFLEKELCGFQDIYVVTKKETASLKKLAPTNSPQGHIDVQIMRDDNLYVAGWAIDKELGAPVSEISIFSGNDLLGKAELKVPRPDIERHFGRQDCLNSGWVFSRKISAKDKSALDYGPMTASIRNHKGETAFLYAFLSPYPDADETDKSVKQGIKSPQVCSGTRPKIYWESLEDVALYQEVMMTQGNNLIGYLASFCPMSKTLSHLNGLVIGCAYGEDSQAISFVKTGAFEKLLIVDAEESALVRQKQLTAKLGLNNIIDYKILDCETDSIPIKNKYDLIFTLGALNHIVRLEGLFSEINESLREDGIFVMREYIGPSDFQYTDKQVLICNRILEGLPDYLKMQIDGSIKKRVRRPRKRETIAYSTKAAKGQDIIEVVERRLEVLACNMTGGTILDPLLHGIAGNFEKGETERAILKTIIAFERTLIEEGVIPSDYVFLAAKKRSRQRN